VGCEVLRVACGFILRLCKDHVMLSPIFVSLALNAVVCVNVYAVVLSHVTFNMVGSIFHRFCSFSV
jgi:hypothetical protein